MDTYSFGFVFLRENNKTFLRILWLHSLFLLQEPTACIVVGSMAIIPHLLISNRSLLCCGLHLKKTFEMNRKHTVIVFIDRIIFEPFHLAMHYSKSLYQRQKNEIEH